MAEVLKHLTDSISIIIRRYLFMAPSVGQLRVTNFQPTFFLPIDLKIGTRLVPMTMDYWIVSLHRPLFS